jgi:hypothetical protein
VRLNGPEIAQSCGILTISVRPSFVNDQSSRRYVSSQKATPTNDIKMQNARCFIFDGFTFK